MSEESKVHTFELKPRDPEGKGIMSGAATQLLMDGQPMKGVRKVVVEVEAGEIAKMTIEVYGRFHVVGQFAPEMITQKVVELVPKEED